MSRLSRQNFGISRLSRPKLGMSRLFRPKRRHFQTFATMMIRNEFCDRSGGGAAKPSRLVFGMPYSRDQVLPFPDFRNRKTQARFSRPRHRRRDFPDQGGDGATFQTKAETASCSRPRRRRRDFPDQGEDGATF